MKRIFILTTCIMATMAAYAQKTMHGHMPVRPGGVAEKPTALGDTLTMTNIPAAATARMLYAISPAGSGYTSGTNKYNDRAFAERYTFNAGDSSVSVLGVVALFGGSVTTGTTKSITLRVWDQGAPQMVTARLYYEGFPGAGLDSLAVPATNLGIGATVDTMKQFMFATPTGFLKNAFFVGYSIDYNFTTLGGDTIALKTSADGSRNTTAYRLRYNKGTAGDTISVDTLLNVQNATQWSDYVWHDNYTDNDSLYNNLAIFPVVKIGGPTGMGSVRHRELTLMGAYPNPTTGQVNIRFGLDAAARVTVTVMDMAGRVMLSQQQNSLDNGPHSVPLATAGLPNGTYIYVVRTDTGSGIGGQFTVAR